MHVVVVDHLYGCTCMRVNLIKKKPRPKQDKQVIRCIIYD